MFYVSFPSFQAKITHNDKRSAVWEFTKYGFRPCYRPLLGAPIAFNTASSLLSVARCFTRLANLLVVLSPQSCGTHL